MSNRWWRTSRVGDRIATAVAVSLAVAYTLVLSNDQPVYTYFLEAVISWCFVPFFWVWRSRPVLSAAGILTLLGAWAALWISALPFNLGVSPWLIAAPMVVYSTARYCTNRRIPLIVLGSTAVGSFFSPVMWFFQDDLQLRYAEGLDFVLRIALHWFLLATMYFSGTKGYATEQQRLAEERERLSTLRSTQEEEKLLIARELHDVLAHSLTLMKVQANAGIVASKSDAHAAIDTLGEIRTTADHALQEVRQIVRALRSSEKVTVQPVDDITGVIAGFTAAGLHVEATIPDELDSVSELVRLAVIRIIAEALTNTVRHQGVAASAHVEVRCADDNVSVEIISTGTPQPEGPGAQMGLVGLEERARSLGGYLSAGGTPEHFRVYATVPLGDAS